MFKKNADEVKIGDTLKGSKVVDISYSENPIHGETVHFELANGNELKTSRHGDISCKDDYDYKSKK